MAVITKIEKRPIGEFTIKFSIRTGLFEIEYPREDGEIYNLLVNKVTQRNNNLRTWDDVNKELDSIAEQYKAEILFTRKVIIIQLQTSASTYDVVKLRMVKLTEPDQMVADRTEDYLQDSEGFTLKWYVADEYKYPRSKHLYYRIREANKNNRLKKHWESDKSRTDILPQLITSSDGEVRVYTYSENLYAFIKELEVSIDNLLHKMIDYFSLDEQKFLANVDAQIKLLNA
jgi:hypothetical protein